MTSYARVTLGLFAVAIGLPLACRMSNPAYDLADGGDAQGTSGGSLGSNGSNSTSAEGNSSMSSTGDGDPSTGDGDPTTGDGDPTTGDGDGDPTTGDGDPTTGDGDPTTGDGDPTTGDGDGDDGGMLPVFDMMAGDGDGDEDGGFIPIFDMLAEACSEQNESCANGEPCCLNLECCGFPVPEGQEYCSNMCPDSDRNLKYAFQSVDSQWVLDQVVELPISTWSYKDGKDGYARHLGPMAQDFHAAFSVGASDRFIFQVDADGVSLAAIQALDAKVDALEAENARLRATLEQLESRLAKLEQ